VFITKSNLFITPTVEKGGKGRGAKKMSGDGKRRGASVVNYKKECRW